MAKTREQKEAQVAQLAEDLGRIKLAVITDYRGLSVEGISQLRDQLRESGIDYRVTKNTLLRIAAAKTENLAELDPQVFTGPTALAMGYDDEVEPARLIFQYAKQNDALTIVGAIGADGSVMTADQVKALAELPSREELTAQLVGTIAAPLAGLSGVLGGNLRGIVGVLSALKDAKEE